MAGCRLAVPATAFGPADNSIVDKSSGTEARQQTSLLLVVFCLLSLERLSFVLAASSDVAAV